MRPGSTFKSLRPIARPRAGPFRARCPAFRRQPDRPAFTCLALLSDAARAVKMLLQGNIQRFAEWRKVWRDQRLALGKEELRRRRSRRVPGRPSHRRKSCLGVESLRGLQAPSRGGPTAIMSRSMRARRVAVQGSPLRSDRAPCTRLARVRFASWMIVAFGERETLTAPRRARSVRHLRDGRKIGHQRGITRRATSSHLQGPATVRTRCAARDVAGHSPPWTMHGR